MAAHRARTRVEVPVELRAGRRWVRYAASGCPLRCDDGRAAASTDPRTWGTYQEAVESPHGLGPGYVLAGEGIVCVDLDHCLEGRRVAGWAQRILEAAPATWIEVSKSGTGLHIWGYGNVDRGRVIRDGRAVEVYGNRRYIAITGKRWRGAPLQLADLQPLIDKLLTTTRGSVPTTMSPARRVPG